MITQKETILLDSVQLNVTKSGEGVLTFSPLQVDRAFDLGGFHKLFAVSLPSNPQEFYFLLPGANGKEKFEGYCPGCFSLVELDDYDWLCIRDVYDTDTKTEGEREYFRHTHPLKGYEDVVSSGYSLFDDDERLQLERYQDQIAYGSCLERNISFQFLFKDCVERLKETPSILEAKNTRQTKGEIYLVRLGDCLKIGFSTRLQNRLNQYRTGSCRVELLAHKSGTILQEKTIHRRYNEGKEKYDLNREKELRDLFKG